LEAWILNDLIKTNINSINNKTQNTTVSTTNRRRIIMTRNIRRFFV